MDEGQRAFENDMRLLNKKMEEVKIEEEKESNSKY